MRPGRQDLNVIFFFTFRSCRPVSGRQGYSFENFRNGHIFLKFYFFLNIKMKKILLMLGPYKEIKPQIYTTSVTWATYLHCTSLSCLWARQRSAQQKLYTTEPAQFILIAASLTCCQTSIIFHRLRKNSEGKFTSIPSDFIDQAHCMIRAALARCALCSLLLKFTLANARWGGCA